VLFYVLFSAIGVLLNNVVIWIDGGLQLGSLDAGLSMFAVYALCWIALYHFLNHYGSRALMSFRPLLESSEAEVDRIDFEHTTLPRNLGWLAAFVGVAIAVSQIPGNLPNALGPVALKTQTVLPVAYFTCVAIFFSAAFSALVFCTIRQLRLITALHEEATAIDLLSLRAPHAFSAFTARIGVGLILILVLFSIPVPWDNASAITVSGFDTFHMLGFLC